MSRRLRFYLFYRNILCHLSMLPLLIMVIITVRASFFLLASLTLPISLVGFGYLPILFISIEFLFQINRYFSIPKNIEYENHTIHLFRIRKLLKPLILRCQIKKPIRILFSDEIFRMDADTYSRISLLHLSEGHLNLNDEDLQSVLAHEIFHVISSDTVKIVFLETLGLALTCYSFVLIAATLFSFPFWLVMIITGSIYLVGYSLYKWPRRIMENTADGATALFGCGHGLVFYLTHVKDDFPDALRIFGTHDSNGNRISKIKYWIARIAS